MHLNIITRGIKPDVDRMITGMQGQYFQYPGGIVELAVRPIQLWELVMPKDSLHDVMRMLWNGQNPHNEHGVKEWMATTALRKMLKCKKIPKFDEKILRRPLHNQNVSIVPIGIKDDKDFENGNEYL